MAGSLENRGKLRELIDKFQFAELRKSEFIALELLEKGKDYGNLYMF